CFFPLATFSSSLFLRIDSVAYEQLVLSLALDKCHLEKNALSELSEKSINHKQLVRWLLCITY
ncbi:hypothetical protein, partial [Enterococcus faecalis]|uniref:hypothetical protein n=1 Tax=Enterococcus faecalis TaxID=1351 RepID=UPI0021E0E9F3